MKLGHEVYHIVETCFGSLIWALVMIIGCLRLVAGIQNFSGLMMFIMQLGEYKIE